MKNVLMTLARAIVRLYPHSWRARYEDELLALVEESGLGVFRALDLMSGAACEWTREVARLSQARFGFRVLFAVVTTAVISAVGLTVAFWLRANVVTPPVISLVEGQRAVLPPRLPSYLGLSWSVLVLMIFVGDFRTYRRAVKAGKPANSVSPGQALGRLAALGVTMPLALWATLVSHYGTGLPPAPGMQIGVIVMLTFNCLQSLMSRLSESSRSPVGLS